MPEATNTPPVETPAGTPPVDTPTPSGLPSDQVPANAFDGFSLTDAQKELFKDGKLNGRFSDLNGVLEKLKESEDNYANLIRDQKAGETTATQAATDAAAAQTAQTLQTTTINEMLPEFINNGMVLTPEMETKALAAKIDIRDLKLGAIEIRDRTNAAHAVVGGREQYDAMLAWGKENMSDAQKASFDKEVTTGGMGEYAIKGLFNDYQTAMENDDNPQRFIGDAANGGIRPYADRRELYKDKDYVESAAGRRDTQAVKNYKARLAATPENIIFGRK